MKKAFIFWFPFILLSACNIGSLNENQTIGDSATSFYTHDWQADSNADYIYYHENDQDQSGTLSYIDYYDLDSNGKVAFVRRNLPPAEEGLSGPGSVVSYTLYQWEGDLLVMSASYSGDAGQDSDPVSLTTYRYDSSNRLLAQYTFGAGNSMDSGTRYLYDSEGNVSFKASVVEESGAVTVLSGTEYSYDLEKDVLFRRSIHKVLAQGDLVPKPAGLELASAGCDRLEPSVSAPGDCHYTGTYNADSQGLPFLSLPTKPEVSSDISDENILDNSNALPHLWDSYWYYDESAGTGAYWGVTFSADPVPVSEMLSDGYSQAYRYLEDSSQEYTDLFSDYEDIYGSLPENIHVPAQFYLNGGDGFDFDGTNYSLDKPVTIDLEYKPGFHLISSKTIKYGNDTLLKMENEYDNLARLSSMDLTGSVLPYPMGIDIEYSGLESFYYWPQAVNFNVNGVMAQRFVYDLITDGGTPVYMENLEMYAQAVHTLWWYDGNYDADATPEENYTQALVGRFVYQYEVDESIDKEIMTLRGFEDATSSSEADEAYTGKYVLQYNKTDLCAEFLSYSKDGDELFNLSVDYNDVLDLAQEAVNGVEAYEDTYNQWELDDQAVELLGDTVPAIPDYLLEGISGDNPVVFLLNEVKALFPSQDVETP